jgi:hypothetical protein
MKFTKLIQNEKFRYLAVGAWNTLFGYGFGITAYIMLSQTWHIIYIAILANVIAITMSFVTYKLFVFKTSGGWLKEYLRIYLVYGFATFFSIILLWIFIDFFYVSIWVGQGVVGLIIFLFSFF